MATRTSLRSTVLLAASLVGLVAAFRFAFAPPPLPPEVEADLRPAGGDGPSVLSVYADDGAFLPLPPPSRGDWRSGPGRDEEAQSFPDYVTSDPVRATDDRTRIVVAPIGPFDADGRQVLERMVAYGRVFFACPVELGDPLPLPERGRRRRTDGPAPWDQYLSTEILDRLLAPNLPDDAIVYLGITMADLYPDPDWNFVFGQANLTRRVGVYSLARYGPAFYGRDPAPGDELRFLERACKVLAHETGHMFGMAHCLHYLCAMNGSNSLEESDRQPLWLCPVCASKLTWNRGFDPARRYLDLAGFLEGVGLDEPAAWYRARAAALGD